MTVTTETEEPLALLRRIHDNQVKALELQAEQLALAKAQMQRAEARVEESIALQKIAVARQSKALRILLPLIFAALAAAVFLLFRHW